ncbi:OsmC-like protein [Geothrix rubra]|uniref:OsmC-like protein n=1 Tax=Geothrix rubra TaxID=2927977 RepID=A0ABQ5Q7G0_9BACT|nr:OsmC family protein [Geothrix rubra]GLH70335.1 OsmC-like protein [Geothrix rubra]
MEATVTWTSGMAFEAEQEGRRIPIDVPGPDGTSRGVRPKGLLLAGLGGCTGMDVVSILEKMRVPFEGLAVEVSADQSEDHPKVFTAIRVTYRFKGRDLPMDKLARAVQLSQEKYCGVSAMLGKTAAITTEIVVEG